MNAPLQAFVLKCPECMAPQPGTTSVCAYCKVPLMWAPSRSFGRDDHGLYDVEDEPGTELMTFGPYSIKGGVVQVFSMQPQKIVRPRFLWIHPRCTDGIYVSNIRLGNLILGHAGGFDSLISGSLFSRGRGWPLETEAVLSGILFSFQIHNNLVHPLTVEGALRVMPFKESHAPSAYGPYIVGRPVRREPR